MLIVNKKIVFILTALLLLLITAIYGVICDYKSDKERIENIELVQKKMFQLSYIDEIITQLQKERGLSSISYKNKSDKYYVALNIQKKTTDYFIQKASKFINTTQLSKDRENAINVINAAQISRFDAFMTYTKIITELLSQSELLILNTDNPDIKNSLIFYHHLNVMQEKAGQLRGLIGGILTSKEISQEEYNEIIILYRLFQEHYQSVEGKTVLPISLEKESVKETLKILNIIINVENPKINDLKKITMEPLHWFDLASSNIDMIRLSIIQEFVHINNVVQSSMEEAKTTAIRHVLLWVLGISLFIIVVVISFLLSKKLLTERKLLSAYKNVIDDNPNSIVSKTDKFGNITYVNDTFCKVSKYSREELIGKPHNIVRHPDNPTEVFEQLWSSIKSGKSWSGVVKNRCKDGEPYWVHAFISPIYNDKGELVEYIAMRHDLTHTVLQNEEVERTQRELIYRMGESVESRSKESGNHIRRVAHYSKTLALLSGLNEEESELIFVASTMHDMGKIAIPDSILLKPGKLDQDEFHIMKTHAEIGYKLLSGSNLPILKMAATIAHEHHERFNGNGYPLGIGGGDISIEAKIVAIVDVFDALISDRVYKKAWDLPKVLDTLEKESGEQFDPTLVNLFVQNIDKFMEIKVKFEDV